MSCNDLKYQHHFKNPMQEVYHIVVNEQLKFFQQYNSKLVELEKGTTIEKEMHTKTSYEAVKVKMIVQELIENKKIEVVTKYHEGDIVTTYEFNEENDGTSLTYYESNRFNKSRHEINFNLVSLFYRWIYKKNMKKRMSYIEQLLRSGEIQ